MAAAIALGRSGFGEGVPYLREWTSNVDKAYDYARRVGPDTHGAWTINLGKLAPGEYGHKFIYGGLWEEEISGVETHWVDGIENRNLRVGDCERPGDYDFIK